MKTYSFSMARSKKKTKLVELSEEDFEYLKRLKREEGISGNYALVQGLRLFREERMKRKNYNW